MNKKINKNRYIILDEFWSNVVSIPGDLFFNLLIIDINSFLPTGVQNKLFFSEGVQ